MRCRKYASNSYQNRVKMFICLSKVQFKNLIYEKIMYFVKITIFLNEYVNNHSDFSNMYVIRLKQIVNFL